MDCNWRHGNNRLCSRLRGVATPLNRVLALTVKRFGISEPFWLNLQTRYDLEMEKDRLAGRLEREVKIHAVLQPG